MITVFTPTFNRAYTLTRLFESLCAQTFRDFEWLVVDDGSTDGTKALCQSFMSRANFPMRYVYQSNAGKHAAINQGASLAGRGWFFIVDSDDWLPVNSLEISAHYLKQIQDDASFAGIVGLIGTDESNLLYLDGSTQDDLSNVAKAALNSEYVDATSTEYRFGLGISGDRAEIVRTDYIRTVPFPVFKNERFLSEGYLWQSLADCGYKFRWVNQITYIGEYLEDGLTKNSRSAWRNSPKGSAFVNNYLIQSGQPLLHKFISAVSYIRYGRLADYGLAQLFYRCSNKLLFIVALPLAIAFSIRGRD